jgi:hypothetical protein
MTEQSGPAADARAVTTAFEVWVGGWEWEAMAADYEAFSAGYAAGVAAEKARHGVEIKDNRDEFRHPFPPYD